MFHSIPSQPAAPGVLIVRRAPAPVSRASALPRPRAVINAPPITTTWMAGMRCYGRHSPAGINQAMTGKEWGLIARDYARHGAALNDPELIINVGPDQAEAHAAYRVLCTQFERPGSYCVRHAEDGGFMLVHRSRSGQGAPALVRTPLDFTAKGWQLHIEDTAGVGWSSLKNRHFETLDALKAALPPGMRDVEAVSLRAFDISHL